MSEIHRRLDSIARQVEQMTRPPGSNGDPMLARQLNEAIARLDARLSQISADPSRTEPRRPATAAPPYRPSPPTTPQLPPVDFSIAEIVARQCELDGRPPRPMPRRTAPMPPPSYEGWPIPAAPQPDFSGIERQLAQITGQIETLRRPDPIEQSIAAFRGELAEIRQAITEALPRRAIESLEGEIRSLGRRIDETRSTGVDNSVLAGIERALSEIYGELRTLKPAEQLAGFDDAIRNLGGKLDQIVRTSPDPGIMRQLEDALAALKAIVANVASNDALNQLAEHVQALSAKVDQLAASHGNGDMLSALEQRIAVLTTALEQRERPAMPDTIYFDNAVRAISDRLDHLQVGGDGASSLGHLEQRIHHLIERLEIATPQSGANDGLARVEQGLSDILRHLEQQRINAAAIDHGLRTSSQMDGALADTIKRELSDLRFSQSESVRHTQDSLETVHNTLGHVVDRLAQIERDLREVRSAPPSARDIHAPETTRSPEPPRPAPLAPPLRPELPNPAAAQAPLPRAPLAEPAPAPSLAEIEITPRPAEPAGQAAPRPPGAARSPIDPSLPPDHPIEPGTRMPPARGASPAERIAASEGVLSEIAAVPREPISSTNFIQAARRAAQAAATATPAPAPGTKANRVTALNAAARNAAKAVNPGESPVSAKIRAVLVGVSVVVIVLGTVRMGMNLLSGSDSASAPPAAESSSAAPPAAPPAADPGPRSEVAPPAMPSITSPTPLDRQPLNAQPAMPMRPADAPAAPDVTGSIISAPDNSPAPAPAPATTKPRAALVPVSDRIPESIGAAALRTAAGKGDPGAAFEIGIRYAEGRGVAPDLAEALKWYERAARGGIVPASFRLGTLYEKGLGTKKDVEAARRHYLEAAEKGNAKAMHNLAVLDADGGDVGPNYKSAAQWFRKAAERGVADSQFNLGILYARGIGVEQNLAESYKWFSLAAAQGDVDSGRKRDDVAKRLDAQSLAAARLAVQTFAAEPQPDAATSTGAPAGGWDSAPAKTAAKSPAAKPAAKGAAR